MYNIALCDDEEKELGQIENLLAKYQDAKQDMDMEYDICRFLDAETLLQQIREHASILGALPYYVIGFFTLINHRKIFPQTGNPVWMYAVYFLCIIYPVCAYFGLYRFPYYFIPALCIASSDICRYYSGRITKNSIGLYSIVVCLIFMGYGGLRLVSIGRTSSILFYKLWFL